MCQYCNILGIEPECMICGHELQTADEGIRIEINIGLKKLPFYICKLCALDCILEQITISVPDKNKAKEHNNNII